MNDTIYVSDSADKLLLLEMTLSKPMTWADVERVGAKMVQRLSLTNPPPVQIKGPDGEFTVTDWNVWITNRQRAMAQAIRHYAGLGVFSVQDGEPYPKSWTVADRDRAVRICRRLQRESKINQRPIQLPGQ